MAIILYPSPHPDGRLHQNVQKRHRQTIINGKLDINFRMRFQECGIAGNNIVFAACSTVVIRIVRMGGSADRSGMSGQNLCHATRAKNRQKMLARFSGYNAARVRVRSRNPNRSSIRRTIWLKLTAPCSGGLLRE